LAGPRRRGCGIALPPRGVLGGGTKRIGTASFWAPKEPGKGVMGLAKLREPKAIAILGAGC